MFFFFFWGGGILRCQRLGKVNAWQLTIHEATDHSRNDQIDLPVIVEPFTPTLTP